MIKEFVIKKSEWLRGGAKYSKLLNSEGQKCCLGFLAQASGIEDENMLNITSPVQMYIKRKVGWNLFPDFLINAEDNLNSADCRVLIRINDEPSISDSVREKLLTKEFKKHGIEVSFED